MRETFSPILRGAYGIQMTGLRFSQWLYMSPLFWNEGSAPLGDYCTTFGDKVMLPNSRTKNPGTKKNVTEISSNIDDTTTPTPTRPSPKYQTSSNGENYHPRRTVI
jgi:hypothetical protein